MAFSHSLDFPISDIVIDRESRQRREIDVSDIKPSIERRGLVHPIVLTRVGAPEGKALLVAGERRLTAHVELGRATIAARFAEDFDENEIAIIELEENLKRQDLDWKDKAYAVKNIHERYLALDPEWTMGDTADALCVSISAISVNLKAVAELEAGNAKAEAASGVRQAYNMAQRRESREAAKQLEDLLAVAPAVPAPASSTSPAPTVSGGNTMTISYTQAAPAAALAQPDVLNASFLDWAPTYVGEKFNFIHCDFPYGVNLFSGPQGGGGADIEYSDEKEVYFELLHCFCDNLENFCAHSSHFIFWFSMRHYDATRALFRNKCPSIEWLPHPLIWHKSDNAGIIGDVRRHPRHIYECALFGFRGSRQVVQSKGDTYSCPTDRKYHHSAKPEPMLKHFFEMTVDEHTRMLDPTCGAGSALRAADTLGASAVLGLEIEKAHADTAQTLLNSARALRKAAKAAQP